MAPSEPTLIDYITAAGVVITAIATAIVAFIAVHGFATRNPRALAMLSMEYLHSELSVLTPILTNRSADKAVTIYWAAIVIAPSSLNRLAHHYVPFYQYKVESEQNVIGSGAKLNWGNPTAIPPGTSTEKLNLGIRFKAETCAVWLQRKEITEGPIKLVARFYGTDGIIYESWPPQEFEFSGGELK